MSNKIIVDINDPRFKRQAMPFLGSSEFLAVLDENTLNPLMYNKLFIAHCAAFLSQTTGINQIYLDLKYAFIDGKEGYDFTVAGPLLEFQMITTQNAAITPNNSCTNSYTNINNDFGYPYRKPRQLRDFLNNYYVSYMKHMPGFDFPQLKPGNVSLRIIKPRDRSLLLDSAYNDIVTAIPELHTFLSSYLLKKQLDRDLSINTTIVSSKLKL